MENIRTIIAIGGGELRNKETLPIDEYACELAKKRAGDRRAVALFLGTASHDYMPYYNTFHKIYTGVFGLKTDCALTVNVTYDDQKLNDKFEKADLIYGGGGDTVFMLEKWKERGITERILKAYNDGKIICGLSAGAICWFEQAYTDSFILRGDDKYAFAPMLGVLKGGACPHYDERKADFTKSVKTESEKKWYCIENRCALVFENECLKTVLSSGGRAFSCDSNGDTAQILTDFTKNS